jgi:dihydrofolate synthase / folylpolyglutamate synthase
MKYQDSLRFLDRQINYEKKTRYSYTASFSLEPIRQVLSLLGDPQRKYQSILIGGTNGKGSTAATLESLFYFHGLKVGLYTSPHLIDVRERMRSDRTIISKRQFAACVRKVKEACRGVKTARALTYFEIVTATAFLFFARQKVDVCVAEVGLGGRLDATNVLPAGIAILTPVSFDHQAILGDRLEEIAGEKAGIIHDEAIVISARQKKEARRVILRVAKAKRAPYYELYKQFAPENTFLRGGTVFFDFGKIQRLSLSLRGFYQLENALLALAAFSEYAKKTGCPVKPAAIGRALRRVQWPGRFELLDTRPLVLLDGAHNQQAIKALIVSLKKLYPLRKKIIIYSSTRDKDYAGNMKCLRAISDMIIFVPLQNERAVALCELEARARELFTKSISFQALADAYGYARAHMEPDGIIVVTGSLFLVGEFKKMCLRLDLKDRQ